VPDNTVPFVAINDGAVLVLFDGGPDNERDAKAIAERLESLGRSVVLEPVSQASVSQVLAADFYVLGAEAPGSPSYAELARVLKGMNLAGRRAAFFGPTGATVAWLRSLCADTEVAFARSDLVGRRPDPSAVSSWLKAVIASF
jgi:Flavodoxins